MDEVETGSDGICRCICGANFLPKAGLFVSDGAIAEDEFDWDDDDEPLGDPDDDLEF
jgi:hypothetical protein